ncbi:DUF4296 domain-containing protein [Chitinophaga nivalis]|uniref:DUF4296 domain-containing protein n=1 Tax=Chitinophaga nivalis TaxID=2991709 RepID=A0ABT3ITH8_9BACT|nr:DUF4296 domain-containing protein [Chitinophaga nivalis]MCW3463295.1 DUF4296 domain-containing protein [Chitinophaga nivalis]MCW3487015.1 DUF4296 domain-containing protein [Chitinophaga nivalis]
MKNKMKTGVLAVSLVFLFACGQGDRVPKEYLSKTKMSSILVDMALADAYGSEMMLHEIQVPQADSLRQEKVKIYYKQILDLHKVTVKEFTESYKYYESHPNRFREVLQIAQASISEQKNKLGNPMDEHTPVFIRLKTIFPYAEKVILIKPDTTLPFIKRQP